jgi:hypothetical protein
MDAKVTMQDAPIGLSSALIVGIRTKICGGGVMTESGENLVLEILRRIQGDMAELKSGQQDIRHRLTLIESRLAGLERNLADQ